MSIAIKLGISLKTVNTITNYNLNLEKCYKTEDLSYCHATLEHSEAV